MLTDLLNRYLAQRKKQRQREIERLFDATKIGRLIRRVDFLRTVFLSGPDWTTGSSDPMSSFGSGFGSLAITLCSNVLRAGGWAVWWAATGPVMSACRLPRRLNFLS